VDVEEIKELAEEVSEYGILDALMTLPDKFRIVLVLYYVEEYSMEDIRWREVKRLTSLLR